MTLENKMNELVARLEKGRDSTRKVTELARWQAATEAGEAGVFSRVVEAHEHAQWPTVCREMFGSLFERSEELPAEERPAGAEWIQALMDRVQSVPSFEKLANLAYGNGWASGIASHEITTSLKKEIEEWLGSLPEQDPEELEETQALARQMLGSNHPQTEEADQAVADYQQVSQALAEAIQEDQQLGAKLERAVGAAASGVDEIVEAMAGLGAGRGHAEGRLVNASPSEVREAVRRNRMLRDIARFAGRLRLDARKARRERTRHIPEQVVDVTMGGEINRLVPSELAQLTRHASKLDLLRRIGERQALQYDLDGEEQLSRGPIIVAVDASGSMDGNRFTWAMAVALVMVELALKERRPFRVFAFDHEIKDVFSVERPSDLTMQMAEKMLTSNGPDGGTDIRQALLTGEKLATENAKWRRSDIIMITDGGDVRGSGWSQVAAEVKERSGLLTYGVAIGCQFSEADQANMAGYAEVTDEQIEAEDADITAVFAAVD